MSIQSRLRTVAQVARDGLPANPEVAADPARLLPLELTDRGSRRTVPLPAGWTRDRVLALLGTISIDHSMPGELEAYLSEDFERFLITWDLVRAETGRVLEIGANPYFTTVLLREFTTLEPVLTNSFDPSQIGVLHQTIAYESIDGTKAEHVLDYHSLNVETTAFPFDSDSFDVVLFCEVIEHLLMDPVAALREIQRVLKPGGCLVVSTPNVARLENIARVASGANIYDPYSGYGPYGRHNREYTRHELVKLIEFVGFDIDIHFTADVHEHNTAAFVDARLLLPLIEHRLADLGQYLFVRARNSGEPTTGLPSEIFRSLPTDSLRTWDTRGG
ncbi:MAG: SAM-dependent methyltransferase [Ilumatobacteraceae bacterium]|nr:SAM-dependent methyltransferase [Ilumatobacteraceae bacterium]